MGIKPVKGRSVAKAIDLLCSYSGGKKVAGINNKAEFFFPSSWTKYLFAMQTKCLQDSTSRLDLGNFFFFFTASLTFPMSTHQGDVWSDDYCFQPRSRRFCLPAQGEKLSGKINQGELQLSVPPLI